MRKLLAILMVALMILPSVSQGGGYQVGLHGQKQIGMGLVGTSLLFDASCMFYNPGGLSFIQQKYSFSLGMSPIFGYTRFQYEEPSVYQALTDNPTGTPFYFYGAAKINEKLSAGLAINTPFGNSLKWEDDWAGRYLIDEISMRAIFFQPTISYKINDMIGIGAGFVYVMGNVELKKQLPVQDQLAPGYVNISGKANSFGFNAGVMIRPTEKFDIGINYRSQVMMELDDGEADFDTPLALSSSFPDGTVKTELPLPANLDLGLSYAFSERFMLAASLNYVFWDAYESLDFDFETNTSALQDTENPRNYSNTFIPRLGAQYKINDIITVRAGGYYDPSPVDPEYFSPETPSLDNIAFTAGVSVYPMEGVSIDASFLYIMGMEEDVMYKPDNFGGTYKSNVYVPGLGVTIDL